MIHGWVEQNGRVLEPAEAESLTAADLLKCGGEFYSDTFFIRDKYGIYPCPNCSRAKPSVSPMPLEKAIETAVLLRSTPGSVVTLSGGVDSSLVAYLSGLSAISVGVENSCDVTDAEKFADAAGISLRVNIITEEKLRAALPAVIDAVLVKDPMSIEIAVTGYFVAALAKQCGAEKILTGQAADELFAGYARYSRTETLRADLDADFVLLEGQRARDSSVAALHNVWYSMPYMDERVVSAARTLGPTDLVNGETRKIALRKAAEKYLPKEIAWKPKKAMQYGSGVSKLLAKIAKKEGVKGTAGLIDAYLRGQGEL